MLHCSKQWKDLRHYTESETNVIVEEEIRSKHILRLPDAQSPDLLKSHRYLDRKSTHKSIVNFVNKVRCIPVRTTKAMMLFREERVEGRRKKREDRWSSVSRRPEKEEEGQLGWW